MSKIPDSHIEIAHSNMDGDSYDTKIVDQIAAQKVFRKHLYTKKIQTPVQEYLSNALDAMILSDKTDQPIKVYLPDMSDGMFRIRDFGPGLSNEDVRDIYANLGVSTKRKNKKAIGCWGYGSKAFFAYTSEFFVISYFNGIETTFLAKVKKDGRTGFDPVGERATDEPNGIEVQCPVKEGDEQKFMEAVVRACFFWKVKPMIFGNGLKHQAENFLLEINNMKMALSKGRIFNFGFEIARILGVKDGVLINSGGIPFNMIEQVFHNPEIKKSPRNRPVITLVLDFENEELEIPPGREFLDDGEFNINALTDRYFSQLNEGDAEYYKGVSSYTNLTELQLAAYNYMQYWVRTEQNINNEVFNYNGLQYSLGSDSTLYWDCKEYSLMKRVDKNKKEEDGIYRRSKATNKPRYEMVNVVKLPYNSDLTALICLKKTKHNPENNPFVKKFLLNLGYSEHAVFGLRPSLDEKWSVDDSVLYSFNPDILNLSEKLESMSFKYILDAHTYKWPRAAKEVSTSAKVYILKDDTYFTVVPHDCDYEELENQIVEVYDKSTIEIYRKKLDWSLKEAFLEFSRLKKIKETNTNLYFVSAKTDRELKKRNIQTKKFKEELIKYLDPEDTHFYTKDVYSLELPHSIKNLHKILTINPDFHFPEIVEHHDLIKKHDEIKEKNLVEHRKVPGYLLRLAKLEAGDNIKLEDGKLLEKKLEEKYPLIMDILDSSNLMYKIEKNEIVAKQFLSFWQFLTQGNK